MGCEAKRCMPSGIIGVIKLVCVDGRYGWSWTSVSVFPAVGVITNIPIEELVKLSVKRRGGKYF